MHSDICSDLKFLHLFHLILGFSSMKTVLMAPSFIHTCRRKAACKFAWLISISPATPLFCCNNAWRTNYKMKAGIKVSSTKSSRPTSTKLIRKTIWSGATLPLKEQRNVSLTFSVNTPRVSWTQSNLKVKNLLDDCAVHCTMYINIQYVFTTHFDIIAGILE